MDLNQRFPKQVADHVVLTESALGDQEVAIVFKPRHEWPKMFKFLKLYREPPGTFIGN